MVRVRQSSVVPTLQPNVLNSLGLAVVRLVTAMVLEPVPYTRRVQFVSGPIVMGMTDSMPAVVTEKVHVSSQPIGAPVHPTHALGVRVYPTAMAMKTVLRATDAKQRIQCVQILASSVSHVAETLSVTRGSVSMASVVRVPAKVSVSLVVRPRRANQMGCVVM